MTNIIAAITLCLLLTGCKIAQRGAPVNTGRSVPTLESHRAAWLAGGGVITNWNGGEHWVARGSRFKPRELPPLPMALRSMSRSMAANSFDAVAAGLNSSTHIDALTAPAQPTFPSLAMPHIPAIVHARQTIDGPDAAQWQHDPAVYSPNVVVDPGTNGSPSLFLHWSIPQ